MPSKFVDCELGDTAEEAGRHAESRWTLWRDDDVAPRITGIVNGMNIHEARSRVQRFGGAVSVNRIGRDSAVSRPHSGRRHGNATALRGTG